MYNPTKAPSQLTSGIPSLFEFVATGGLRILGVIVRMPKKSPSEAYMFLLKKFTTITLILILTLGGKV